MVTDRMVAVSWRWPADKTQTEHFLTVAAAFERFTQVVGTGCPTVHLYYRKGEPK